MSRTCSDCPSPIGPRNLSGFCRPCCARRMGQRAPVRLSREPRSCACGAALGERNVTGRCRPCSARRLNEDPALIARRTAGIAEHFADPAVRAANAARLRQHIATMSDEEREWRRENGRRLAREVLARPEVRAKAYAPEVRARSGRKRSATVLAWCPADRRDEYRELKAKGISAAEARRVIEASLRRPVARGPKRPLSFEQQLARVAAGAPLVATPRTRATTDHDFTLGGVSAGLL